MNDRPHLRWTIAIAALLAAGCGTTKLQEATEQLVLSSAVDRSIAMIDFRPLAGQRVYLDTTFMHNVKSPTFVNADYVTSAMRQQIMAAGCLLQEQRHESDIVLEPRIGTLGADDHRVTYGIPEDNGLASAASFYSRTPTPTASVPELAIARRDAREGAAKIAVFAYERETRNPVWQSGISQSIATSRNTWVLGIGPFQGGTIREGRSRLARGANRSGRLNAGASPTQPYDRPVVEHTAEVRYDRGWPLTGKSMANGSEVGSGLPISGLPGTLLRSGTGSTESGPIETRMGDNKDSLPDGWSEPAMIADEPSIGSGSLRR